ncbi:hypothetical protein AGMMS49928_12870 [Spirochaetia bacterium]|nr:hypothetical protein AGMMS49928_12870 [Spirochaetia bacterium]
MADETVFQGELDPELAELLGTSVSSAQEGDSASDLDDLLDEFLEDGEEDDEVGGDEPDLGAAGFPVVTKKLEENPHNFLNDPNYYKIALSNEEASAQRLHGLLQKYLNTKDPKDKSLFRQQMIPVAWELLSGVAKKAPGNIVPPKKFFLRFAILHPTFLNADTRTFFGKIVVENELDQPIYYLDEWLRAIGTGAVKASTTDEARVTKSNANIQLQQLMDKAKGKLDGSRALLKAKHDERSALEQTMYERVKILFDHVPWPGLPGITSTYSETQKKTFAEVQEISKSLLRSDRELESFMKDLKQAQEDIGTIQGKMTDEGPAMAVDTAAVAGEFDTVRQMSKMNIGRQGNQFPILTSEYFHCTPNDVATRENVIAQLAWIESIDQEAYCRVYKNRLNRIVPFVLLLPNYGDTGFCWEPFDRHNRATSRGRIVVPMYPKSLPYAVLTAVADLRWQVAKEKASSYWMEEGLTGNYYQWFQKQKVKGQIKEYFIQDYILWMTKESEGTQKLDKELRGIFWRYMPFSQPIKEKLKDRSFIYQELYQRDLNRAKSDL